MEQIARREVKTRKPHRCFGCGTLYPHGTDMSVVVESEKGRAESTYWCEVCEEVMSRTFEYGDTCSPGDLYAGDPAYWREVKREIEAQKGRED